MRIDDLDTARTVPGASDHIIQTLARFGFEWDGEIVYQSRRGDLYREALDRLKARGAVYRCTCTRREIADSSIRRPGKELRYPGKCRAGIADGHPTPSWRARVSDGRIRFRDRILGPVEENLEQSVGDFIVLRADGVFGYQLAVVVDDAAQGISEVVRGADLLSSTFRQVHLQRQLGLPMPDYAHLPVITDRSGTKLSKQTRARPLDETDAAGELRAALGLLGQALPDRPLGPSELLDWAVERWDESTVPRARVSFRGGSQGWAFRNRPSCFSDRSR